VSARAVVLVEGISDRIAVLALAERRGIDLDAAGVAIVAIGGAQAIGRYLERYGPGGEGLRLAGLCDAPEERLFRRALEHAGLGSGLDREGMERLGFFTCERNLEDELIRAVGADDVVLLLERTGDIASFRTFQRQPQWRGRPAEEQLTRYLHSADRRNTRYPPLLIAALDLDRVPRPLDGVLAHATKA
jgi:hypothetical protein